MNKKTNERFEKAKGILKKRYNPKVWLGYSFIKDSTTSLIDGVKKLFIPPVSENRDEFESAVREQGLTPQMLSHKQKSFLFMTILSLILFVVVMSYTIHELAHWHYLSFFPSLVLSFICLAMAFRYHFWYFQIKSKKLGCTIHDWLDFILPGRKKHE